MADRRPGRPRAIPEELIPEVLSLHRQGFGYRAVSHQLERLGVSAHWTTVRRIIKRYAKSESAKEKPPDEFYHYFATGETDQDDPF